MLKEVFFVKYGRIMALSIENAVDLWFSVQFNEHAQLHMSIFLQDSGKRTGTPSE